MNLSKNMSIEDGCTAFLNQCKARNYSKYTIKYYENTIHNFSLFYDISNSLKTISKRKINEYGAYLRSKNLSDETILTYIRGLRTILYYLMDENLMDSYKIELPKVEEKIKETYTERELKALLKKPDVKECSFAHYRDWVLVNYLLGTGQRLNTVIHVKIQDVDLENNIIKLKVTKGKRQTLLPLSIHLNRILEEYLQFRKGDADDYLFCNATGGQMSRGCITGAIRRYNRSRGVTRTSIHLFRHTYAKNYLMNGGDVFRLQKLMCHKEIETTKGYLNLTVGDLEQNYDHLNPLDVMQKNQETIKIKKSESA